MSEELITELRRLAGEQAALLLYTETARQYVSGFPSSLGYLFVTKQRLLLLVDGRYYEAAKSGARDGIEVCLLDKLKPQAEAIFKQDGVQKVLLETAITVAQCRQFDSLFSVPAQAEPKVDALLSRLRGVKSANEVFCIEQAQRIAEQALEKTLPVIAPGVRETEIAAELEYHMKRLGGTDLSFQTIVVSGTKSAMPHGVPDDKIIADGDFVTMDFGTVYGGYHSDMTRTVAVGHASAEMRRVYDTVLAANEAALATVAAGVSCRAVDAAARNVIDAAGYGAYFNHSTGHGVGLEIHEMPNLSPKNDTPLEAGQIVTIEPGIYLPGRFGVRIEDMVFVTKNGCNNLTKAGKKFIIV